MLRTHIPRRDSPTASQSINLTGAEQYDDFPPLAHMACVYECFVSFFVPNMEFFVVYTLILILLKTFQVITLARPLKVSLSLSLALALSLPLSLFLFRECFVLGR